jgi:putative ABC transport system permease protein
MDEGFLSTTEWEFMYTATGYESKEAVVEALRNDPSLVIVDSTVTVEDPFGPPLTLDLTDQNYDGGKMDPIPLTIIAADGTEVPVTVIGVIDDNLSTLFGVFGTDAGLGSVVGPAPTERYYIQSPASVDTEELARQIEALTLRSGVQVISIQAQLEEAQRLTNGFLYLIQGFMGLGLIVGIAAVGVISFRSVVERRQQIGMLRALGMRKEMVSLAFLIETAYVVILGVIAGTVLGILLAKNLLDADSENIQASFTVPYGLIAIILFGTVIVALLTAWVPSRQASNIAPADALRYE